jgi:hypothetical protein
LDSKTRDLDPDAPREVDADRQAAHAQAGAAGRRR